MRRRAVMVAVGLVTSMTTTEVRAAPRVVEPILILPFAKLSKDRDFPWLDVVITVTLGADIHASTGMKVLGWKAVAPILTKRPRFERRVTEVKDAVEVGRAVGAGSVILGGYVNVGSRGIKLETRLIDVRSGKVIARAEAGGPNDELFRYQDEVLAGLLGKQYTPPDRPPVTRGKKTPDTLEAYSLYALSVTGTSQSNRHDLLTKALEKDPGFSYATNDMREVEKLAADIAAFAKLSRSALDARLREHFDKPEMKTNDLHEEVMDFFGLLENLGYHRAIVTIATRVYTMSWTEKVEETLKSDALYWQHKAYAGLKNRKLAIEVGERYVKEYSTGRFFYVITRQTKKLREESDQGGVKRERLDKELRRFDLRRIRLEAGRCQVIFRHHQYLRAIRVCGDFVGQYGEHPDNGIRGRVRDARWSKVMAHHELGRFDEARTMAEAMIAGEPEWAKQRSLRRTIDDWPQP
ncbi:MAG: hypothetical protein V3T05_01555 [Myxococcota bacterium]